MAILVTGSHGYIGSVLGPMLSSKGIEWLGVDACWYGPENQERLDFRDLTRDDLSGVDAIVHLAALCNDPLGDLRPELTRQVNHQSVVELARRARAAGVARFVFASSASVYGVESAGAMTESSATAPQTIYAASKLAAESQLLDLASDVFSPTSLRLSTVYGLSENFRDDLVVNTFLKAAVQGHPLHVHGGGQALRPFVEVRDLCALIMLVLYAPKNVINGEIFNVGLAADNWRILDLANLVARTFGARLVVHPSDSPDYRSYALRFDKIVRAFPQWRPAPLRDHIGRLHASHELETLVRRPNGGRLSQLTRLLDDGMIDDDLRWVHERAFRQLDSGQSFTRRDVQ